MPKSTSRPKTHKHKPGKFSNAQVHKLHKLFMKADKSPSMIFRRGRKGRGMKGCGVGDLAEDEKYNHLYMMKAAKDMLANGASMKEVKDRFPSLV
jgi:hypothetical protein